MAYYLPNKRDWKSMDRPITELGIIRDFDTVSTEERQVGSQEVHYRARRLRHWLRIYACIRDCIVTDEVIDNVLRLNEDP